MIKHVFLFANGNVACTDETGQQVTQWQKSLLCDHLREMHDAGAIDRSTKIELTNGTFTLDQLLFLPTP